MPRPTTRLVSTRATQTSRYRRMQARSTVDRMLQAFCLGALPAGILRQVAGAARSFPIQDNQESPPLEAISPGCRHANQIDITLELSILLTEIAVRSWARKDARGCHAGDDS